MSTEIKLQEVKSSIEASDTQNKNALNSVKDSIDASKGALVFSLSAVESKVQEQSDLLGSKLSSLDNLLLESSQKLSDLNLNKSTESKQDDTISKLNTINNTLVSGLTISQAPSQSYFFSSSNDFNYANVKGESAKVWSVVASNMSLGFDGKRKYIKFYDMSGIPDVSVNHPVIVMPVDVGESRTFDFNGSGMAFPQGLSFIVSEFPYDYGVPIYGEAHTHTVKIAVSYS
jgi:hypothetical protein